MKTFLNMNQISNLAKYESGEERGCDSSTNPHPRAGRKGCYGNKAPADTSRYLSSQQEKAARIVDVPVLRRAAMDLLARREHSHYELQQKLKKKFPGNDLGSFLSVLDRLSDEGLQSDERFAESYSRYRKNRGFGYLHINSELKKRHVDQDLVDHYLFSDDEDWHLILLTLISKRVEESKYVERGSKEHRKIVKFLESRGFQAFEIRKALKLYLSSEPLI